MARQAASYRNARVLLAGDAAHVHYPSCGQVLNIGVQDAVNLGWKLAQVINGTSPERLPDTYHVERHPVAACVLRNTISQVALLRTDDRTNALRDIMSELLNMDEPLRRLAAEMSDLEIQYASVRDIRCSVAACQISTCSLAMVRCGSSLCCTMPDRCYSTSVSLAAWISAVGQIAFS
jgi:hypothetical protein